MTTGRVGLSCMTIDNNYILCYGVYIIYGMTIHMKWYTRPSPRACHRSKELVQMKTTII